MLMKKYNKEITDTYKLHFDSKMENVGHQEKSSKESINTRKKTVKKIKLK